MDNRGSNKTSTSPPPPNYASSGQAPIMPPSYRGTGPPMPVPPHQQSSTSYSYGPSTSNLPSQSVQMMGNAPQQQSRNMQFPQQSSENMQWPVGNSPTSGGQQQHNYGASGIGYGHHQVVTGYQQQHTVHHRGPPPPNVSGMYSSSPQRTSRQQMHPQSINYGTQPLSGIVSNDDLVSSGYTMGGPALGAPPPPPPTYYMSSSLAHSFPPIYPGGNLQVHHVRPQHYLSSPGSGPPVQQQSSQTHAGFLHAAPAASSSMSMFGGHDHGLGLYNNTSSMPLNQPHLMYGSGPPPTNFLPRFPSSGNVIVQSGLPTCPDLPEAGNYPSSNHVQQQVANPASTMVDYLAYLSDIRSSSSALPLRGPERQRRTHAAPTESIHTSTDDTEDDDLATSNDNTGDSPRDVVSLAELLDVALQTIYNDYTELLSRMPSLHQHPVEKKASLVTYCWNSRNYLIQFYAAYEWSSLAMPKVLKCGRLIKYCCEITEMQLETADFLAQLARETLALTKLSFYQVPIAIDVLTMGTYKRLPSCLRREIVESNKLSCDLAAEKPSRHAFFDFSSNFLQQQLMRNLSGRLIQRDILPDYMRLTPVVLSHSGLVTLTVAGECKFSVTIDSLDNDAACWRIASLSFLLPDFGISGGSGALSLINDKTTSSLRSIGCIAPKQVEFLREVLQESIEIGRKSSLIAVCDFLHDMCANLKFDILLTQLLQLEQSMTLHLNDSITADFDADTEIASIFTVLSYESGRSVTVAYWQASGNATFRDFDDDFFDADDENVNETAADEKEAGIRYTVSFSYQKPTGACKSWRIEHSPSLFHRKPTRSATTVQYYDAELDMNAFMPTLLAGRCVEKLQVLHAALSPWRAYVRLYSDTADFSSQLVPYVEIVLLTSYFVNPNATSPANSPTRSFRVFVHQYTGMYYVSRHHLPTALLQFAPELQRKTMYTLKKFETVLNRAFCHELLQHNFTARSELNGGTDQLLEILFGIEKLLLKGLLVVYCQSMGLTAFLPDVLRSRASALTSSYTLLFGREKSEKSKILNEALFFRLLECENFVIVINLVPMSQHLASHADATTLSRLEDSLSTNDAANVRLKYRASLTKSSLPHSNTRVHAASDVARLPVFSVSVTVCAFEQSLSTNHELKLADSGDFYSDAQKAAETTPFLCGIITGSMGIPACPGCSALAPAFLQRLESVKTSVGTVGPLGAVSNRLLIDKGLSHTFLDPNMKTPLHEFIPLSKLPQVGANYIRARGKQLEGRKAYADRAESGTVKRRTQRLAFDDRLENFGKREGICLSQNFYELGTTEAVDAHIARTAHLGTELSHAMSSCVEHLPFFELQKALVGRGFTLAQPFSPDGRGGGGTMLTGKRGIHTLEIVRFPPAEDQGDVQFHRVFEGAVITYVPRTTRILDPIPIGVYLVTLRFANFLYKSTPNRRTQPVVDDSNGKKTSVRKQTKQDETEYRKAVGRNTLMVPLNYQAVQTTAEVCARVAEDLEADFRAMAKIYGFLYTWWRYEQTLYDNISLEKSELQMSSEINDPVVRSILSTVEVKHYDVANLSFCYRMSPLFAPPSTSSQLSSLKPPTGSSKMEKHVDEQAAGVDDDVILEEMLQPKKSGLVADPVEQHETSRSIKKRVSLASLFIDCQKPSAEQLSSSFSNDSALAEYEMHLSWDSRQRVFNVGLRCAAAHGIGTNPHLVIRDLLSQQLESACSMKQERERLWSPRQYRHIVDMLYNLSVTIRPITLLGALACRSPLIQYDPRIDFAYTVEAGQTPSGATNPTRGWYNHSPYRMRPLKPNVYRLEMCKRMRLLFVVNKYGQVLVGDEGLPIYCAYKRKRLLQVGGGTLKSDQAKNLLSSLMDDDVDATQNVESSLPRLLPSSVPADSMPYRQQQAEVAGLTMTTSSGPGPPPPVSSSSIIQANADTSLRSLLMRPVSSSGSGTQYGGGHGPPTLSSSAHLPQLPAAASARPPLPPVVMPNHPGAQPQQPSVFTVPRTKSTLPLGLHFQLMRPTIYLFDFFAAWQQHLRRLITKAQNSGNSLTEQHVGAERAASDKNLGQIFGTSTLPAKNRSFLRVSKKLDLYELETALFCFLFTPLSTLKRQLVDHGFMERTLSSAVQSLNVFSNVSLFEQFMTSCYVLQMLPIWLRDEISEACQLIRPTAPTNSFLSAAASASVLHQAVFVNAYSRFHVRFSSESLYTELNFLVENRLGDSPLTMRSRKNDVENENADNKSFGGAEAKMTFNSTDLFTAIEAEMLDALFRRRICITPFNVMKMASWFKLLSFGDGPLLLREILHLYFHQFGHQWLPKMEDRASASEKHDDKDAVLNQYQQLNSLRRSREQWRWTVELCFHQPIDEFPRQLKLLEPPIILLPTVPTTTGLPLHRVLMFFRFESRSVDAGDLAGENAADVSATSSRDAVPPTSVADVSTPASSTATTVEASVEKSGKSSKKESAKKRKKRLTDAATAAAAAATGAPSTADNADSTPSTSITKAVDLTPTVVQAPTNFGKPRVFYLPIRYELIGRANQPNVGVETANVVAEITDEQIAKQPLLSRVRQTWSSFMQTYNGDTAAGEVASGAPTNFKLIYLLDAIARNPLV